MRTDISRRSQVAHTARGPVEYIESGDGPAVLAVHGAMGGYDQSDILARTIGSPGYRYIAVSRPGYLRTPLDVGREAGEQADAHAALLDALGIDDAVVMAVSGGGPSALEFALRHGTRHGGRCRGLVLVSTCGGIIRSRIPVAFHVMQVLLRWPACARWLRRKTAAGLEKNLSRSISDPAILARVLADPDVRSLLEELTVGMFDDAAKRLPGTANDIRVTRATRYALEQIDVPTLVVHGDKDCVVPFEQHGKALAARIPGARLLCCTGGEHVAIFTHRDLVREHVARFLTETRDHR